MNISNTIETGWIAVIVVNYGTAELAINAVQTVLDHSHGGRMVRVFLVDNASPGDDAKTLTDVHERRAWGKRVTLFLETENHGFGRGNNVVLRALAEMDDKPDKVLLLNPDAALHNEAIDFLAKALDKEESVVAVGAAVLRDDMSPATAAFRFPSWRSEFARILAFGPIDRLVAKHIVALPPDHPAGSVDWVTGAAVMFRFDALVRVNFFDPGFFLYYEEVDLMRRLRKAGGDILYVPTAQVLHAEGAATGQFASAQARQRDPSYLYQSWRYYFERSFGRIGALCIAATLWPAAALNILHRRMRGKSPSVPLFFFRDHWTHVIGPLVRKR